MRIIHLGLQSPIESLKDYWQSWFHHFYQEHTNSALILPKSMSSSLKTEAMIYPLDVEQKGFPLWKAFFHILQQNQPTIIHIHDPRWLKDLWPVLALRHTIKVYASVYVNVSLSLPYMARRVVDHWVLSSQELGNRIQSDYKVSDDKMSLIPFMMGLDYSHMSSSQIKACKAELNIAPDRLLIGNTGPLVKEEDQITLLKAVRKMLARDVDVHVLIRGEGPMVSEILQAAKNFDLESRLTLVKNIFDEDQFYSLIDILIQTGYHYSRPLTILRAMSHAVPVIATNVGANAELIQDRKTGYLVPCGYPERIHSAVMRLRAIASLQSQLGQAALDVIQEQHQPDVIQNVWREFYQIPKKQAPRMAAGVGLL